MSVIDIWVNVWPPKFAATWTGQAENESIRQLFGDQLSTGTSLDDVVGAMDAAGVDAAMLTVGLRRPAPGSPGAGLGPEDMLEVIARFPGRFRVSSTVESPTHPTANARRVRELSEYPDFAAVHVSPLLHPHYSLSDRLYYPVYAACEEAGLPVIINVGIPGPKVRSACQDPVLLEDLLIDFPDLVIVGAHMGHPYESLLVQYMLKWPNLYLSNSAYLARYMDERLVAFMDSSRGRGRVLFASDHPVITISKALDSAKALPLTEDAMAAFLGGTAERLFFAKGTPIAQRPPATSTSA